MAQAGARIRSVDVVPVDYDQTAADSAAITTTETVVGTLAFTAVSGAVYEIRASVKAVQSVATDWFLVSVREDSVSGTTIDAWGISNDTTSYGRQWTHYVDWTAASSAAKTIVVTLDRLSGSGNIVCSAKSNFAVRRIA